MTVTKSDQRCWRASQSILGSHLKTCRAVTPNPTVNRTRRYAARSSVTAPVGAPVTFNVRARATPNGHDGRPRATLDELAASWPWVRSPRLFVTAVVVGVLRAALRVLPKPQHRAGSWSAVARSGLSARLNTNSPRRWSARLRLRRKTAVRASAPSPCSRAGLPFACSACPALALRGYDASPNLTVNRTRRCAA